MPMQFWRNLGYLLCLLGLWFHNSAVAFGGDVTIIVAFLAFWGGALLLAVTLFFDWVDQSGIKDKK